MDKDLRDVLLPLMSLLRSKQVVFTLNGADSVTVQQMIQSVVNKCDESVRAEESNVESQTPSS